MQIQPIASLTSTHNKLLYSLPNQIEEKMAERMESQGGKGGSLWDDGSVHDAVTKIQVGPGGEGIQYIEFEYLKNGPSTISVSRGALGRRAQLADPFVINHPEEYLVSVEGWYKPEGAIQGLIFKTNKKPSDLFGFHDEGTPFKLEVENKKIIGFHGFSGDNLHSLGAYFAPLVSVITMEPKGSLKGVKWDDKYHENVRKISVSKGMEGLGFIKFEYINGSQLTLGDDHGKITMLGTQVFEVDEDDHIVLVEGYYEQVHDTPAEVITDLRFTTYKGKVSIPFGMPSGKKFVFQGGKIVGFHGYSTGQFLFSIGAHITYPSTPTLTGKWNKIEQKGEGPGKRSAHDIAVVGNKIYSFGGESKINEPIDKHLYVFDLTTQTWSIMSAIGDIKPDFPSLGVGMVSIGSTLYIYGGRGESPKDKKASITYNDLYTFDTINNEWNVISGVENQPEARSFHSMATDGSNVYVFSGLGVKGRYKSLHAYNIVEQKWVILPTKGSFTKRERAGAEFVNGKLWTFYGFNGDESNEIHVFDPIKGDWTKMETFGEKPCARSVFASGNIGKYIVIFGGEIGLDPNPDHKDEALPQLSDGTFALDTETLKWEKLDKVGVGSEESPSARGWSASTGATINGKKGLLMFGGKGVDSARLDDLYFYEVDSV